MRTATSILLLCGLLFCILEISSGRSAPRNKGYKNRYRTYPSGSSLARSNGNKGNRNKNNRLRMGKMNKMTGNGGNNQNMKKRGTGQQNGSKNFLTNIEKGATETRQLITNSLRRLDPVGSDLHMYGKKLVKSISNALPGDKKKREDIIEQLDKVPGGIHRTLRATLESLDDKYTELGLPGSQNYTKENVTGYETDEHGNHMSGHDHHHMDQGKKPESGNWRRWRKMEENGGDNQKGSASDGEDDDDDGQTGDIIQDQLRKKCGCKKGSSRRKFRKKGGKKGWKPVPTNKYSTGWQDDGWYKR